MRVESYQNKNRNPYFGIMRSSATISRELPDLFYKLQNSHRTNPICVTIVKLSEIKPKIITIYDHLFAAIIKDPNKNNEEFIFENLFLGKKHFLKKVFERTQKDFYTNS